MGNTFYADPTISPPANINDAATFVALMLPEGVNFSKNGVVTSTATIIASALAQNGNDVNLTLAMLFQTLESDQYQRETIGKYSYERYGMRGSDYWRLKASSSGLDAAAPNVLLRPGNVLEGGRFGPCR